MATLSKVKLTSRGGRHLRLPLRFGLRPQGPCRVGTGASPGTSLPFATYSVDVEATGYYRQFFTGVPVYDGITSIQPANLVPFAQNASPDRRPMDDTYFNENVNPLLRPAPPEN